MSLIPHLHSAGETPEAIFTKQTNDRRTTAEEAAEASSLSISILPDIGGKWAQTTRAEPGGSSPIIAYIHNVTAALKLSVKHLPVFPQRSAMEVPIL